jgi:CxC2 like cysteine cluster associated with KDZ transposases
VVNQTRTCRCLDCFQSPVTCERCFIQRHKTQPFHWVEQWNGAFFIRRDISALGHPIALGHRGELCHNISKVTPPLEFLIVHTNGIHRTKLLFCGCVGCGNRMQQLLKAQLFPATTEQPTTAFTFAVLREFHLHSLESVVAAHGYMGALRRLTDNTFTTDVPVSSQTS